MNGELEKRPEFLPQLPKSDSIWGDFDILNSQESSREMLGMVMGLIDETGAKDGIYIAMRQVATHGRYQLPLQVFDGDPSQLHLPFDDMVTMVSGPLSRSEAVAGGYILETAEVTRDIFEGNVEVTGEVLHSYFDEVVAKLRGQRRFVPLGLMTIHDYIARMAHYRSIKDDFEGLDMDEEDDEDMAVVVGLGIIPLAKAFKKDGYRVGQNFQDTIDRLYVGNQALFIPFAGFGGHPQSISDWQMVGLGLYTGVRLFRQIEDKYREE